MEFATKCIHVESVKRMTRIVSGLYVGTVEDIPFAEQENFSILGACKDPLHRKHARLKGASEDGYVTKAMQKEEPEYLFAERDHALYLNLIAPKDMKYIPDEVINKGLDFIDKEIKQGRKVLIVCNKAESRSPSIALMWMIREGVFDYLTSVEDVIADFIEYWYPNYNPSAGMKDYLTLYTAKAGGFSVQRPFPST